VQPVREPVPQLRDRPRVTGERPVEQCSQLGAVALVGVVRDPGLGRIPQLELTRH
jgi:hypothetical protein